MHYECHTDARNIIIIHYNFDNYVQETILHVIEIIMAYTSIRNITSYHDCCDDGASNTREL